MGKRHIFTEKVFELIESIDEFETCNIEKASEVIFQSMKNGGLWHVFSTGHSHMVAEELFYRAGGLAQVNPILEPFLMQHEGAYRSTKFERLPGIAEIIFDSSDIKKGEPILIVSNSGINSVPIEMADFAKQNGNPVIVLTSLKVSQESVSRDVKGRHLYDMADIIIDNHCPRGDGVINGLENGVKVGAVSTLASSYIAQRLVLSIVERYKKEGLMPPIYLSANVESGDQHNESLVSSVKGRVRCLY